MKYRSAFELKLVMFLYNLFAVGLSAYMLVKVRINLRELFRKCCLKKNLQVLFCTVCTMFRCILFSTALRFALYYVLHCITYCMYYLFHCITFCTVFRFAQYYVFYCVTCGTVLRFTLYYVLHYITFCTVLPFALYYVLYCTTFCTALRFALYYVLHCITFCTVLRFVVYHISIEIYSSKWECVKIVHKFTAANQKSERWILTSEKSSFAAFDWTNDIFSRVKNDRTGKYAMFLSGANEQNIFEVLWATLFWENKQEHRAKKIAKRRN